MIDFPLSAGEALTGSQVDRLLAILARAPKPLLVHCDGGADRTGIVAAIYVAAIAKRGEDAAEDQLSILFGHLPFSFAPGYAMDLTFEALEPRFGFFDS
jgi:hypothetical protein